MNRDFPGGCNWSVTSTVYSVEWLGWGPLKGPVCPRPGLGTAGEPWLFILCTLCRGSQAALQDSLLSFDQGSRQLYLPCSSARPGLRFGMGTGGNSILSSSPCPRCVCIWGWEPPRHTHSHLMHKQAGQAPRTSILPDRPLPWLSAVQNAS